MNEPEVDGSFTVEAKEDDLEDNNGGT